MAMLPLLAGSDVVGICVILPKFSHFDTQISWHSTTPIPTPTRTSSPTSSRGCPCRCRCRRRGMPAIQYMTTAESWNSTGPSPTRTLTPTLGMRLSCNFVNVYTIAYRVHVYTLSRASLTDILAMKIACVWQFGGPVGEDPRACPARTNEQHYRSWLPVIPVQLNREVAGHADIIGTILAWKSARMSVSVSVSVGLRVGAVEFQLKSAAI